MSPLAGHSELQVMQTGVDQRDSVEKELAAAENTEEERPNSDIGGLKTVARRNAGEMAAGYSAAPRMSARRMMACRDAA